MYYLGMSTILFAHFDGKQSLVLDESVDLPVGALLRLNVEQVSDHTRRPAGPATVTQAPRNWQSLDIKFDPKLSHAIAIDPEFNIE
jgi:hypothetical protein